DHVNAESGDYTVGQVSSSLFPEQRKTGALSSLFSPSRSSNTLVFIPAPEIETKVPEAAFDASVKHNDEGQKRKKTSKKLSDAEKTLQHREMAFQIADEGKASVKKVKRKQLNATEEQVEGHIKHRKKHWNIAEERVKMKRTVFVGNLPSSCSKKNLLSLFKSAGPIESIRFRSVIREDPTMSRKVAAIQRKVHPKQQNINAYIVFKEEESAGSALKLNGEEIQTGFYIRVDRVSQNDKHDHKRSIFVGNLPYDIQELPLRDHFEQCGNIEAVRLVRDRDSGMGKGFGYILFESSDSVMLALKLNGSTLMQRKIRVKRSTKKEKEKPMQPRGKQEQRRGGMKTSKQDFRKKNRRLTNPFRTKQTPTSAFIGETADPAAKKRKKPKLKKKKNSHI
ncbi:hypothetical protein DNTS_030098, partial [Danionella cerebrum]